MLLVTEAADSSASFKIFVFGWVGLVYATNEVLAAEIFDLLALESC